MKLYTKQGDDGTTRLFGGQRVSKSDPRVVAYGEVDEVNAALGWAASQCSDEALVLRLRRIQRDLFVLGAELATPADGMPIETIEAKHISILELWIDEATSQVPELCHFILPGGVPPSAALHLARTIARRAERSLVRLAEQASVRSEPLIYLNRLSDLLFAFARLANHQAGEPDVVWRSGGEDE